jgi:hypothetical protein
MAGGSWAIVGSPDMGLLEAGSVQGRFAGGAGVGKLSEELAGQIHAVVERRRIAEGPDIVDECSA